MLGFAMKAGRVTVGADLVCKSLAKKTDGAVQLVVLAATASEATKKRLGFKCEYYGKRLITVDIDGDELGRLLGKTYSPAVIAITDRGFAEQILLAWEGTRKEAREPDKILRKEVSQEETGEAYASSNQNNSDN